MQLPVSTQQPSNPPRLRGGGTQRDDCSERARLRRLLCDSSLLGYAMFRGRAVTERNARRGRVSIPGTRNRPPLSGPPKRHVLGKAIGRRSTRSRPDGHTRRQLLGGPTRTAGFKQVIGSGKTCSRPQAALHVARCVAPRRRSMTRVYASVSEPGQDSCRQGDRSRSSAAAEGSPVCRAHFQDRECGVPWSVRSRRRDIDAWKD